MKNWTRLAQILLLCACTSANAGAHEVDVYLAAGKEFEKIIVEKTAQGSMPRLGDKGVAELIGTLSDSQRFLNSTTYQTADLMTLINMCTKTNVISKSYTLFDAKSYLKQGDDQAVIAQQLAKLMGTNILSYQNELEQLYPFMIRCFATAMPLLSDFVATLKPEEFTEVRRGGLQQTRNGVLYIYNGHLQAINFPEIKKSFKEKTVQALAETAVVFATIIQPAARQQIVALANIAQKNASGEMINNLQKIIDAMSTTECTGLCKL